MTSSTMPITSDPDRVSGKVCIGETRMPAAELLIHLTRGGSIHTFCEGYGGMRIDELKDVLKFATHDLGYGRKAVDRARVGRVERRSAARRRTGDRVGVKVLLDVNVSNDFRMAWRTPLACRMPSFEHMTKGGGPCETVRCKRPRRRMEVE